MVSAQIGVWDLWSELSKESDALSDPVFLECMEASSSDRIFDDLSDDKLKASLSLINSLLNDPKTRPKGLTLFSDFALQINPSKLVGLQSSITSGLHLIVKSLESPLACSALSHFLRKCHLMTETNQLMTTSIIPKILANFCEGSKEQNFTKSIEELTLLKTCLEEYHGPCGQYRDNLERNLVSLMDSDNIDVIDAISQVMPLLSYAGGGGSGGEKHTKDWTTMLTKVLKAAYSTLYQLYGDNCPTLEPSNPFEGDQLSGFKRITEPKVLLRLSLLKRRLQNLLTIITGYLRFPFPAPKLVPQRGVLKLIGYLSSVNSLTTQKTNQLLNKESVFLSAVVPGIHIHALKLLSALIYSVGSNIFVEAVTLEQILSSEFKWLQEKPRAFEKLKLELYETLLSWLTTCGGIVTNVKILDIWIKSIGGDTRTEKDVVELKVSAKPKPGKSVLRFGSNSFSLNTNATQTYVQKSPEVTQIALQALLHLIPALDPDNHRRIYEHLVRTASIINQFHVPPSPFDSPQCRYLVYENLSKLSYHPQSRSAVSLNLLLTLLKRGLQDPIKLVSAFCSKQISYLERLIHPISTPLSLLGPAPNPILLDCGIKTCAQLPTNVNSQSGEDDEEIMESEEATLPPPKTDEQEPVGGQSVHMSSGDRGTTEVSLNLNQDSLQIMIKNALRDILKDPSSLHSLQQEISTVSAGKSNEKEKRTDFNLVASPTLPQSQISSEAQPSLPLPPDNNPEVIDIDDNSLPATTNEQSQSSFTNGNGNQSEGESEESIEVLDEIVDVEDDVSKKRKNPSEDAIDEGVPKKVKTVICSPAKTPPKSADGPSVEEMISSFVDDDDLQVIS